MQRFNERDPQLSSFSSCLARSLFELCKRARPVRHSRPLSSGSDLLCVDCRTYLPDVAPLLLVPSNSPIVGLTRRDRAMFIVSHNCLPRAPTCEDLFVQRRSIAHLSRVRALSWDDVPWLLFARPALYRAIHGGGHARVKETLHEFGRNQEGRNHGQQKREIAGRRMHEFEPPADPRQEG
jgi:hypothetical protein